MENPHPTQTLLAQENTVSHSNRNPSLPLLLSGVALITAVAAGGIGYYLGSMQKSQTVLPEQEVQVTTTPELNQVACTMEAKLCPDGSSVGRSGPNCEFAECPTVKKVDEELVVFQDSTLGLSLSHPSSFKPTKMYSSSSGGEPIFIISDFFNFKSTDIPLCSIGEYEGKCILDGKGWGQAQDILKTELNGKPAESFFVQVKNDDGKGSKVIHVVQKTEVPTFEIVMTVDGAGLEEQFQEILKTIKLTR